MTEQQRRAAFHKATGRIATSDMEMYYGYIRGLSDGAAAMKERAAKACERNLRVMNPAVFEGEGEQTRIYRQEVRGYNEGVKESAATIRALGDDDE